MSRVPYHPDDVAAVMAASRPRLMAIIEAVKTAMPAETVALPTYEPARKSA